MTNPPSGRRAQNRVERHSQLMNAATELIAESGLDGLTMQAVAERVHCAVGTIYTYFTSKSSLLAELQIEAIKTLSSSVDNSRALWDQAIEDAELDEASAALVRLVAIAHLFTSGPELHPREFELLQVLISSPRRQLSEEDTPAVVPHALAMVASLHAMIESAVAVGALSQQSEMGEGEQQSLRRTLRWLGGLNGALIISNATADPAWLSSELLDGRRLAIRLAEDMYLGWGAPPLTLAAANAFVYKLEDNDQLMRHGGAAAVTDLTDLTEGAAGSDDSEVADEVLPGS